MFPQCIVCISSAKDSILKREFEHHYTNMNLLPHIHSPQVKQFAYTLNVMHVKYVHFTYIKYGVSQILLYIRFY